MDQCAVKKGKLMQSEQEKLQSTVAHLQKTLEDLSDVVARQDLQIARLERRVQLLMERAAEQEVDAGGTIPLADQKPPHW